MKWSSIRAADLEKAVLTKIDDYKNVLNKQEKFITAGDLSWQKLIQPLEDAKARLDNQFNIISHLHSVQDNLELREAYSNILPKLSDLNALLLQNNDLYQKILQFKQSKSFVELNFAQQKIIENLLLDFKLAGVDLSSAKKLRYQEITKQLADLSDQFSKNVLDATNDWHYYINSTDNYKLAGLPEHTIESAKFAAEKQGFKDGWVLTLDWVSVDAVLRYATNREIRRIIYTANVTKASEKAEKFDNSNVMQSIVRLRRELAKLLGFNNYSEYSLCHKMAKNTKEVLDFLDELKEKSGLIARQEFLELQKFAKLQDSLNLEPWDVSFYTELYKKTLFNLSDEELRCYFQLKNVLLGMFNLANSLYGINIEEVREQDVWDEEVKYYKVVDQANNLRGFFYIDLYVRDNKRSGAWMAELLSRHKWDNGELQQPVAFLVTNFAKGPLLYHEELLTLLHEFGHVLHHVLTKVDYINASGCNGVSWDAVELPSQLMEKWGYDWQFLQEVSEHYKTKEKISEKIFNSLVNIKNYNAGMNMARQLEFAMFDFKLHMYQSEDITVQNIQEILDQVRSEVTVVPIAEFNRFQHGFSHIFAGGYAAGYYSYYWAEVLASDAFMAFKEQTDHKSLGSRFLNNVLEMGGSKDAMDLYMAFRGKKPEISALLEQKGLIKK